MKPSFTIDLPNWAGTQAARRLIAALSYDGNEARFAGGAVRDSLIGRSVTDVDIATTGAAPFIYTLF